MDKTNLRLFCAEDSVPFGYNKMSDLLDKAVYTQYKDRRSEICELFNNPNIDMNKHRELIKCLAMFNINEVDKYWAAKDRCTEMNERVLEVFDGFVYDIEDGRAYVELTSQTNGDKLDGQYDTNELAEKGIGLEDSFVCRTIIANINDKKYTRMDIEKVEGGEITY